jgi:hypothetical protein
MQEMKYTVSLFNWEITELKSDAAHLPKQMSGVEESG